jgi:hypothetical protein
MVDHLSRLLGRATVVPAVNQIEVHPYFTQREVQDFGAEHAILTQAWSPIGGVTARRMAARARQVPEPDGWPATPVPSWSGLPDLGRRWPRSGVSVPDSAVKGLPSGLATSEKRSPCAAEIAW